MKKSFLASGLSLLLSQIPYAHGKAVFAHYMVGDVTEAHAHQDIDDAMAMGFDGFALNIGDATQDFVDETLGYMFGYSEYIGFKLYISLDVYASGAACFASNTSCDGPGDYYDILKGRLGSTAYYLGPNTYPLISTFSSGGWLDNNWTDWKQVWENKMYFIPDFDETSGYYDASDDWYDYWGDIVDGVFSWESAWPLRNGTGGLFPGDVSPDVTVIAGAVAHNKGYMIGLSTLQYKNSYGTNVYRGGDTNLPVRMKNILEMSTQPDFVQVQTWNDGPESHYIGNIWPEQNTDTQPAAYMKTNWDHTAWQPLITSFIDAWKAGGDSSSMEPPSGQTAVGAMWYKTILQDASCRYDGEGQFWNKPEGFGNGTDTINWAVVVAPDTWGLKVIVHTSAAILITTELYPGLNYGSDAGLQSGDTYMELQDADGNVLMRTEAGQCVSGLCPDDIYNMNYQVVAFTDDTSYHPCLSNGDAVEQVVTFYGVETVGSCNMASGLSFGEIWTQSNAGPHLDAIIDLYGPKHLGARISAYANGRDYNENDSDECATLESSSCTRVACSTSIAPELYYITLSFEYLHTSLAEWQDYLTAGTVLDSLDISTIVENFGISVLKPQIDSFDSSAIFTTIGSVLAVSSPLLGLLGEDVEIAVGMESIIGGAASLVGSEYTNDTPDLSELRDDAKTLLESRLGNIFEVYYTGVLEVAENVFVTGSLENFPDWVYSNTGETNLQARFFSGGRYLKVISSFDTWTSAGWAMGVKHMLIGYMLKSANVYILIAAHDEANCQFAGSVWQYNTCYSLEIPGSGATPTAVTDDISTFTKSLPTEVIESMTNTTLSKGYEMVLADVINNAVACQNGFGTYDGVSDSTENPVQFNPYPTCTFTIPVINVEPWYDDVEGWEYSPCRYTDSNPKNDKSGSVTTYLPDNLAKIFTKGFCFEYY